MPKLIAALVALALLAYLLATCSGASTPLPADPVTGSISLDLRMKEQAAVTVGVTGMSNRLAQAMAAGGGDAAEQKALRSDLQQLHRQVEVASAQLILLGDSPTMVDEWLQRIQWPPLLAREADYLRTFPGN